MRVMLTGATGYIGGHTAAALSAAEHEVVTRLVREHGLKILGLNYKDQAADAIGWLAGFPLLPMQIR